MKCKAQRSGLMLNPYRTVRVQQGVAPLPVLFGPGWWVASWPARCPGVTGRKWEKNVETKITVTVFRSTDWLHAQRLADGHNYPESVDCEVSVPDLSLDARKVLLLRNRGYPLRVPTLGYWQNWEIEPTGYCGWGRQNIVVDAHNPTPAEISAAIVAAVEAIAQLKIVDDEDNRRRAEEDARYEAEKAARTQKRIEARELLKEELDAKDAEIKRLRQELADGQMDDEDEDEDEDK